VVGGVLLLAVVAVLFLLIGRGLGPSQNAGVVGSPTPSPSPTISASPTQTAAAPAPAPEDTTPRFTSFDAVTEVQCPNSGDKPEIQFSWQTAHAVEVWYTSGDDDAIDDNYMQVPLNGDQGDLTDEHLFPCAHRGSQDYTLTLLGDNGEHVSQRWTVVDLNWQGDSDDGN
jgi:hypothetical protein